MNYCGQCGASVERIIPTGDTKPRDVCSRCGHIHYENPRIIAGCLPVFEDKVLLCQRAIEPRRGKWTLPAGFLENAETMHPICELSANYHIKVRKKTKSSILSQYVLLFYF